MLIFAGPTTGKTTWRARHPLILDTDDMISFGSHWPDKPWRLASHLQPVEWKKFVRSVVSRALNASREGYTVLTNLAFDEIITEADYHVWRSDPDEILSIMRQRDGVGQAPDIETIRMWKTDVIKTYDRCSVIGAHWLSRNMHLSDVMVREATIHEEE